MCDRKVVLFGLLLVINGCSDDIDVFQASNDSMAPTVLAGEKVTVDTNAYPTVAAVGRWDVIAMSVPSAPTENTIRRVIGLPGEMITFKSDEGIFVDGLELAIRADLVDVFDGIEPNEYSPDTSWQLSANEFFVVGDNWATSADSRFYGPIKFGTVVGKASK